MVPSRLKRASLGLALSALAIAALQPVIVAIVDGRQARENAARLAKGTVDVAANSRTAVVYYSRSGNTALMAQRIAEVLHARIDRLEAPDYHVGLPGWARAMLDARKHVAAITPGAIDLSACDSVYLGSPIWLYSPAPPIWQFVDLNDFEGKHVVLFNTFNSQFQPEYIEAFKARVMKRGAKSFEHRSVRRGRMTQQISTEELLQAVDAQFPPLPASPRSAN